MTDDTDEPPESARTSYTWLIPIAAIVLVVAAVVVGLAIQTDLPAPDEIPDPPDELPTGEDLYVRHCVGCHGREGAGVPGRYPPLVGTERVLDDPEGLIIITLYGMRGPIEVQGVTYDDVMPGFSRHLSNEEAALLLTHVRSSWNNDAEPITAEDVAEVRDEYPPPDDPWSVERLEARDE